MGVGDQRTEVQLLRAAVHGFAVLEAEGAFGFPEKLDESYDLLIDMMTTGLHASH